VSVAVSLRADLDFRRYLAARWPLCAALAGLVAGSVGVRTALVLLPCFGVVAAVFAWTAPLRRLAAEHQPAPV
jgi:hypothetical protein